MSNHIRELRQAAGLSLRELADRLSTADHAVHFTTVAKIERSQRALTPEWVARFSEALGVKPSELSDDHHLAGFPLVSRQHPVIGMVSAGNWREAVAESDEFIAAPVTGRNVFGLTVDGTSMDRIAPNGSTVMVDPDLLELHDGHHYVVMNGDGEATFKQYRANPARLEPCSTDPQHKAIMLGQEQFTIVGRVLGVYQQL